MKTINVSHTNAQQTGSSLYQVVDQVLRSSSPVAARNRNSIVNDVPSKLYINTNEETVTTVIRGMVDAEIANATDSIIHVSAKELYGNMIEVNVKDDNCLNTYAVALSLQDMVPLAEKIGGNLDITFERKRITTVTFRFPLGYD